MKIKTITCHDVYNYGASLQAYALQYFLLKKGHDVEIIDYKPDYLSYPYHFSTYVDEKSKYNNLFKRFPFLVYVYAFFRYLFYLKTISKKKKYDSFTRKYLHLTNKYKSREDLINNPPDADIYIVGSDQVWNSTTMQNGKDSSFFLDFGAKQIKRFAYAASFGSAKIDPKFSQKQKEWLKNFDGISVRESSGIEIVKKLGKLAVHVCDPVFLLGEKDWSSIEADTNVNCKYVLIYNLPPYNSKIFNDAKIFAQMKNVKIVSVSPFSIKGVDFNMLNAGPSEFVRLIRNAECVFTNSFHGTSFSLIMHKEFYSYNYHSISNSSRIHSILEEVGLLNRLNNEKFPNTIDEHIDYESISGKIESLSEKGKNWINEILK